MDLTKDGTAITKKCRNCVATYVAIKFINVAIRLQLK